MQWTEPLSHGKAAQNVQDCYEVLMAALHYNI